MFRDDPFFSSHSSMLDEFDRMDRMMSFGMPGMMQPPAIGHNRPNRNQQGRHRQGGDSMMPFGGSMLGGSLFPDMNRMMQQMEGMQSNQGQFFSSSKVISYSSDGSGSQPKYYEATSETTQGPDGVRQTRKSERNSETGLDRMAVGHHIYDRGHVVERIRNNRTNEREEKQDFINLDEDDRDRFHQEWQSKARTTGRRAIGENSSNPYHSHQPRAIDSAEYRRNHTRRPRASHSERRRDYDGDGNRHVRINSRPEEI